MLCVFTSAHSSNERDLKTKHETIINFFLFFFGRFVTKKYFAQLTIKVLHSPLRVSKCPTHQAPIYYIGSDILKGWILVASRLLDGWISDKCQ